MRKENVFKKILGILLIIIAIAYFGNQFFRWRFTIFFPGWWALLMIIPAIYFIIQNGFRLFYLYWIVLGSIFIIDQNHFLMRRNFEWYLYLAITALFAGIYLLLPRRVVERSANVSQNVRDFETRDSDRLLIKAFISTKKIKGAGLLKLCRIEGVFANVAVDLVEADLSEISFVNIDCFGGVVNLYVRENLAIQIKKDNAFGRCKIYGDSNGEIPLLIRCSSIFGTINIHKIKVDEVFEEVEEELETKQHFEDEVTASEEIIKEGIDDLAQVVDTLEEEMILNQQDDSLKVKEELESDTEVNHALEENNQMNE